MRALAQEWVADGRCQNEDHAYRMFLDLSSEFITGVTISVDGNRIVHVKRNQ